MEKQFENATLYGNLKRIRELFADVDEAKVQIPWYDMLRGAVCTGQLEMVRYLVEEKNLNIDDAGTFLLAISSGNLDLLKYLHDRDCWPNDCPTDPIWESVANLGYTGGYKVVSFLRDLGYVWTPALVAMIAYRGDASFLRWVFVFFWAWQTGSCFLEEITHLCNDIGHELMDIGSLCEYITISVSNRL